MKKSGVTSKTASVESAHDSAKARFFYAGVFALRKAALSPNAKRNASQERKK